MTAESRPLRQEIAEIVRPARTLIKAHENRSPTSDYATLGEEEALMFLKERINALDKRMARRPVTTLKLEEAK